MENVTYEELEEMYHESEKERLELDETCDKKNDEIKKLEDQVSDLEVKVEELETELQDVKPQTVYGELKGAILRRLSFLTLEELQNIEVVYAPKEMGFEWSLD